MIHGTLARAQRRLCSEGTRLRRDAGRDQVSAIEKP